MVRTVMGTLSDADQTILKNALADRDAWSNTALAKALTAKGLPLGEKIVRERRKKPCDDCVCRVG
jgi:hypothetical protein